MVLELVSENKNPLFNRKELVFVNDSNVSFEEAKKLVAEKIGKPKENIDVYNIKGKFGNSNFEVLAKVYESEEELNLMKNMELSKKKKKEIEDAKVKAEEETKKVEEESANASNEDSVEEKPAEESSEAKAEERTKESPVEEIFKDKVGEAKE